MVAVCLAAPVRGAELLISTENTAGHPQTQFLETFATALSGGIAPHTVVMRHSAQAYRGQDEAEALATGKIAFAAPGIWLLGQFNTDLNALLLPAFMGWSGEALAPIVDGALGQHLNAGLEANLNAVVIGPWLDLGPAHIFTRDQPVSRFSDLKGLRIRYAGGAANARVLEALGAIPVLIPWPDVPNALDRGAIDGLLTTASTVVSAKLWDHGIHHGFLSGTYYAYYVPLASRPVWNRLSASQKTAVRGAWGNHIGEGRERARASQQEALGRLRAEGVILTDPGPEDDRRTRLSLAQLQAEMVRDLGLRPDVVSFIPPLQEEAR